MSWIDTYDPADLPELHTFVDFIICMGGDGLILHAAKLFGSALPPVISFKLGSLGFLTSHRWVGEGGERVGEAGKPSGRCLAVQCGEVECAGGGVDADQWRGLPGQTNLLQTALLPLLLLLPRSPPSAALYPPLAPPSIPPLPTCRSYLDYRRHLDDVVHGCEELSSCELVSPADGRALRGVHVTLRMRLECEIRR